MLTKLFSIILFTFLAFNTHVVLHASGHEILPTYHWSYTYISEMQLRGYCLDLSQLHIPYIRSEVASSLIQAKEIIQTEGATDVFLNNVLQRLLHEFDVEIMVLQGASELENKVQGKTYIHSYIDKKDNEDLVYRGIYRGGMGVSLGKNMYAFSGVNFDQYDYYDPAYQGYKWRGFAGYTEQAYLCFRKNRFYIKFGRDFLRWGAGQSGTLILSNMARPLDQLYANVRFGPFSFSFIASELDRMNVAKEEGGALHVRRYLSGHRLGLSLMKGKLQAAVSEVVIYGDENATFNTIYLNPVIFYHGAKKNGAGDNNVLPIIDLLYYPYNNLKLYTSLLIDDIQIEKTGPGDLEPNEIGLLIGSRWADPFRVNGLTVGGEYAKVTNRTYKTPTPWEVFIHRNVPLGHPLGNDFEYWQIDGSYWFHNKVQVKFGFSRLNKGEGSLFTAWDTPWMDYTVDEGYSEPFPSGVVEQKDELSLHVHYYHSVNWGVQAELHVFNRNNADHIPDNSESGTAWRIGFWWDGEIGFVL